MFQQMIQISGALAKTQELQTIANVTIPFRNGFKVILLRNT